MEHGIKHNFAQKKSLDNCLEKKEKRMDHVEFCNNVKRLTI